MAVIVRFKNILGGSLGDINAGVNLVSAYRTQFSGDGGASLDFNTQRTDFRQKLLLDLKNRFAPVYGYTSAKVISASSVTTRIGIQIIFNPAGGGGDFVDSSENLAGITFASNPAEAIQRWQEGSIDTYAYTTTQQIINLGISAAASIMPGGSASKAPVYFTDGTTMGMVLHPAISFDGGSVGSNGVPNEYFYNNEYPIPQSAFQLAFADQWSSATRNNGYIFFGEGGRGESGWQLQGQDALNDTGLGPFVNTGEGILPIWSNYDNSSQCGPLYFSESSQINRWYSGQRASVEAYQYLCN